MGDLTSNWVEIESNLMERICAVNTTTQKDTPEA